MPDNERELLAERDQLMGEITEEGDLKKRQDKMDRVDEVQKQLGQAAIYSKGGKAK